MALTYFFVALILMFVSYRLFMYYTVAYDEIDKIGLTVAAIAVGLAWPFALILAGILIGVYVAYRLAKWLGDQLIKVIDYFVKDKVP